MRQHAWKILLGFGSVLACGSASAQEAPAAQPQAELWRRPTAALRLWGDAASAPAFDPEDAGQRTTLGGRLRVNWTAGHQALLRTHDWSLEVEADVLTGRLAGDAPGTVTPRAVTDTTLRARAGRDWHRGVIDPRKLWVGYRGGMGQVRLGMQANRWGVGMLANGGEAADEGLFNQRFGGDRVIRALVATAPLYWAGGEGSAWRKIFLAISADLIWRDENADLIEGDRAAQGIVSAFYRDGDPKTGRETLAGVFLVYRDQEDRDGAILDVWAFDAGAHHQRTTADGRWDVRLAVEAAALSGKTTRAYPRATPGLFETTVRGFGVATEASARHNPSQVHLKLKAGMASGDSDTDDSTLYRFRFDPNYKVGLVLFDHYMPAVTRAGYTRAVDLDRSGQAPRGADGLLNTGSIENAWYVNPQVLYGDPKGVLVGLGVLGAVADKPVFDPYASFERGGALTNVRGGVASRTLGWEIDAAVQSTWQLAGALELELKAEYGILLPGAAFDDVSGVSASAQQLARGRVALRW